MSGVSATNRFDTLAQGVRFILVAPSHPGNVGAAARAIKTMGFGTLVLVAPRHADVLADPEAQAMASGAHAVLTAARVVPSLDVALEGVQWSLALSARPREYGPPLRTPREAGAVAARRRAAGESIALVFGNERTGLENEDVERCAAIAHIPANPVYSSLNLAQAIQVLAYEMRLACLEVAEVTAMTAVTGGTQPAAHGSTPESTRRLTQGAGPAAAVGLVDGRFEAPDTTQVSASAQEIEGMFAHLQQALVAIDFLDPDNPKKLMSRLRRLFARSGLEREEVNVLRGIAKHILARRVRPVASDAKPTTRDDA